MSKFTDLKNWYLPLTGIDYITVKEVPWEVGRKGSNLWLIVPDGYTFNVSIPRCLWWLLSPQDPRFLAAACLHDYALHVETWDRVSAAAGFSDALKAMGVGRWTRLAMVLSVIAYRWR